MSDVDLRGAEISAITGLDSLAGSWISDDQLSRLAPSQAAHLNINLG